MVNSFPTKAELRCAGCSLIISQILLGVASALHAIEFSAYDVKNEQDVIKLHDMISSESNRSSTESAVAVMWIAFPFLLFGLYGLKESTAIWYEGTTTRMLVYVFEKAYLLWMAVVMIIIPALSLVSVTYDWSFHTEPTDTSVPIGYYVQVYVVFFRSELIDCAGIADATFVFSIYFAGFILSYGARVGNEKWRQYVNIVSGIENAMIHIIGLIINCCCIFIVMIACLVILFEYAESTIGRRAKVLMVLIFLSKIYLGIWMLLQSRQTTYDKLKRLVQDIGDDGDKALRTDAQSNYEMDQITTNANM